MIYQYITNEILEREINSLYNTRHLTINSFLLNLSSNILSPRRKQRFYLTILFDETKYRNISYSITITNNAPIIPSISKRKKVLHRKNCLHLHFLFIHIPSSVHNLPPPLLFLLLRGNATSLSRSRSNQLNGSINSES